MTSLSKKAATRARASSSSAVVGRRSLRRRVTEAARWGRSRGSDPAGVVEDLDEQRGDVVLAAAGVGELDRGRGGVARVELEQIGQGRGAVEVLVQAVGAQQQAVADL